MEATAVTRKLSGNTGVKCGKPLKRRDGLFKGVKAVALLVPNEGEIQLLSDLLMISGTAGAGTLEAWSLRLFTNVHTPVETDTAAAYTEATYTGYAAKTLIRDGAAGHWSAPTSVAPTGSWSTEVAVAEATYAVQTFTALSTQVIQGYYITGVTSGKLIAAENFTSPQTISVSAPLSFEPRFGAA